VELARSGSPERIGRAFPVGESHHFSFSFIGVDDATGSQAGSALRFTFFGLLSFRR
jgi:hypothetical protein